MRFFVLGFYSFLLRNVQISPGFDVPMHLKVPALYSKEGYFVVKKLQNVSNHQM